MYVFNYALKKYNIIICDIFEERKDFFLEKILKHLKKNLNDGILFSGSFFSQEEDHQ